MSLSTRPLAPAFGVEIMGVDIAAPDLDSRFPEIRALFEEHSLLLFRDQSVTDDIQAAFSARFGPVLMATSTNRTGGTAFSRQSNVDPKTGALIPPDDPHHIYMKANRLWHSDGSYRAVPALCSLLSAREVSEEGGATEFASMRAAWETLPDERKAQLEGLIAEHSLMHSRAKVGYEMTPAQQAECAPVRQALVRENPVNGRKSLFVGAHAAHIEGLSAAESEALLTELVDFCTQPQFVYSHRWRVGDLVVYDNRCLLHRATPFDHSRYRRFLQRTTVGGDTPTVPQAVSAAE